uniref:Uncharacterized protein n=1 Tax=Anopheles stephensi TaxID=30069 RepID=A0A182XYM0_ANOST
MNDGNFGTHAPHPSVVPKAQEILKIELPPVRPITVISSNSFDPSVPPGDATLSDGGGEPGSPVLGCDYRCPLGSTVSLHTLAGTGRRTVSERHGGLSHSRISLRSETTGSSSYGGAAGAASSGGHHHHHHHHHHAHHAHRGHSHRRHSQASQQASPRCTHHRQHQPAEHHHHHQEDTGGEEEEIVRRRQQQQEEDEEEEEVAGTTATICTEDERHAGDSASTMYAENCHCSRGNLTTTDDDDEIQQYFVVDQPPPQQQSQQPQPQQPQQPYTSQQMSSLQRNLSRRPSVSSSHRSARSTPRSRRVTTPLSGASCCSHHSHHSQPAPVGSVAPYGAGQHGPQSPAALSRRTLPDSGGSNATISNFNINPARFQCSYYTADESENSYCSISGENIRQIQAQTAIQHQLDREEQRQRLQPLPLAGTVAPVGEALINDNDSQQDIASLNESLLSTVGSTSSDQPGGSTTTTTSTTTSTTQRQLQQVQGTPKSAGSQLVLTPSKITIENIGQLSEIGTANYEFDDLDINIPEIFQSPSKIKWSFLANLDESKSNKSRISSVSSLVDAGSSTRGRSGTESGGADVSETASDNEYSPNRIRRRRPEPLPVGEPSHASGAGIQASSSSCKIEELLKKSSPSASASDFKTVSIWRAENGDEGNAIIFHHESEIVENCCTNHFLDHSSYDVCRVDNCDYLIKSASEDTDNAGTKRTSSCGSLCKSEERLNNTIMPSTTCTGPGTKQLELKQRNIFTSTLAGTTTTSASMTSACGGTTIPMSATTTTVYSIISPDLKRFEKQTNLNRNSVNLSQNMPPSSPSSSSTSSIFAGNYGSAVYRNINQQQQQQPPHQTSEHDKLLNTSTMSRASSQRSRLHTAPASSISRSATSSLQRSGRQPSGPPSGSGGFNNQSNNYPSSTLDRSTLGGRTLSTMSLGFSDTRRDPHTPQPGDPAAPPFSITGVSETAASTATTAAAAAATQFYNKSYHYNLTAQNQLYFQAFSNLVREQEQQQQQNCEFHQAQPQTPSPQPQPSCPQCYEYYGCQAQYYANATNEADNEFAECNAGGSGGVVLRRGGWRRNVGTTLRINGLVRVVRTRARKCADYIRQKEHQSNNRFRRRK